MKVYCLPLDTQQKSREEFSPKRSGYKCKCNRRTLSADKPGMMIAKMNHLCFDQKTLKVRNLDVRLQFQDTFPFLKIAKLWQKIPTRSLFRAFPLLFGRHLFSMNFRFSFNSCHLLKRRIQNGFHTLRPQS